MIVYNADGVQLDVDDWGNNTGQVVVKWRHRGKWYSLSKVWVGNKVDTVNEVFMSGLEMKQGMESGSQVFQIF